MVNIQIPEITNEFVSYLAALSAGRSHVLELGAEDFTNTTRSLTALVNKINDDKPGIVILTGNAGHGKTHLCAASLCQSRCNISWSRALELVQEFGHGAAAIPELSRETEIYLIKDLTELPIDTARDLLIEAADNKENRLTIICANEGRLRTVSDQDQSEQLDSILDALNASLRLEKASDSFIQIINLNFQKISSNSSGEVESILEQLLNSWTKSDNWTACNTCPLLKTCAIRNNTRLIDYQNDQSIRPFLASVIRLAELIGYQFTIRQLLVAMATVITNGKDCSQVQIEHLEADIQDMREDSVFSTLFKSVERHPTSNFFRALEALDPGTNSNNFIDSSIDFVERSETLSLWWGHLDELLQDPMWQPTTEDWRFMRRIRVTMDHTVSDTVDNLGEILQIKFLQLFQSAVDSTTEPDVANDLKRQLFRGLEAIQGIRTDNPNSNRLSIADQSFSDPSLGLDGIAIKNTRRDPDGTRLLSSQLQMREVVIKIEESSDDEFDRSVNHFANRFSLEPRNFPLKSIPFDYRDFLYVLSAANGLNANQFFAGQNLRILRALDGWAAVSPLTEVTVLTRGKKLQLMWDNNRMTIDHD
jgi:hypothetical protein